MLDVINRQQQNRLNKKKIKKSFFPMIPVWIFSLLTKKKTRWLCQFLFEEHRFYVTK